MAVVLMLTFSQHDQEPFIQTADLDFTHESHHEIALRSPPRWASGRQEVKIVAEPPYVGLMNSGVSTALNSVLQVLFHLPAFRSLVYTAHGDRDSQKRVRSLQNVFQRLETSQKPVPTGEVASSFEIGFERCDAKAVWDGVRAGLLTGASSKFASGFSSLFDGRWQLPDSTTAEPFWDLTLSRAVATLEESLAQRRATFVGFPAVLLIHLRDDARAFAFPRDLAVDGRCYQVFGVLVSQGSADSAHHMVYIRAAAAGAWWRFDDSQVTRASAEEALEAVTPSLLVYVRGDAVDNVFAPVAKTRRAREDREWLEVAVVTDDAIDENARHAALSFQRTALTQSVQTTRMTPCREFYGAVRDMLCYADAFDLYALQKDAVKCRIPHTTEALGTYLKDNAVYLCQMAQYDVDKQDSLDDGALVMLYSY
jgi:hypothetical protein